MSEWEAEARLKRGSQRSWGCLKLREEWTKEEALPELLSLSVSDKIERKLPVKLPTAASLVG